MQSHPEEVLEIPLDSLSAAKIAKMCHEKDPAITVPRWPGVKYLNKKDNREFQARASELAAGWGVARVHLDIYFWVDRN